MSQDQITLKDIIGIKNDEQLNSKFTRMENLEILNKIKDKTVAKINLIQWPKLYNEILKKFAEALEIEIIDIIAGAWIKSNIFQKYKQVEDAQPDETVLIPVAEHSVNSKHSPYLEILLNEKSMAKINFEINLSIKLKGIILKIRNKKLKEIHTGECAVKVELNCENIKILDVESKSIKLLEIIPVL